MIFSLSLAHTLYILVSMDEKAYLSRVRLPCYCIQPSGNLIAQINDGSGQTTDSLAWLVLSNTAYYATHYQQPIHDLGFPVALHDAMHLGYDANTDLARLGLVGGSCS